MTLRPMTDQHGERQVEEARGAPALDRPAVLHAVLLGDHVTVQRAPRPTFAAGHSDAASHITFVILGAKYSKQRPSEESGSTARG